MTAARLLTAGRPEEGIGVGAKARGSASAAGATGWAAVEAYLDTLPEAVAARLAVLRALVRRIVPEAVETMSYGIPTFDLYGRHLVHVAGHRRHVGFYPGSEAVAVFAAELAEAGYRTSRGTIQLPHDRPLPLDLIERIVSFRVAEERARAKAAAARRGRRRRASSEEAASADPGAAVGD